MIGADLDLVLLVFVLYVLIMLGFGYFIVIFPNRK